MSTNELSRRELESFLEGDIMTRNVFIYTMIGTVGFVTAALFTVF